MTAWSGTSTDAGSMTAVWRRLPMLGAMFVTVGLSACGGASNGPEQKFHTQAGQICREINAKLATAPGPQKLPLGRQEIQRLSALTAPANLREKFHTYIANESDYYRRAEAAIAQRNKAAADALNPHQDDQLARDLGITDCG